MGKWVHIIESISEDKKIGVCRNCGPVKLKKSRNSYLCANSRKRWDSARTVEGKERRLLKQRPYRSEVKDRCERCGFLPEHKCQLDVHHIDEDHKNNAKENLKTLCANCHRLIHSYM